MFAGEKKRLQLVFDNSLIGVAIDRFGKEIPVLKESETQFRTFVEISVSKQFYGWLAGIGRVFRSWNQKKNKRSIGSILKIFGNYDILPLIMRICINYAKEDKNERNRNPD